MADLSDKFPGHSRDVTNSVMRDSITGVTSLEGPPGYQACNKQCHTDNQDDDLDCKYSNARAIMELSERCSLFTDQLTTDDHYTMGQETSATLYTR